MPEGTGGGKDCHYAVETRRRCAVIAGGRNGGLHKMSGRHLERAREAEARRQAADCVTAGEHAGRVRGRLASYPPGAVYHTHRRPAAQLKQRRHAVGPILAIDPSSTRTGFAVLNVRGDLRRRGAGGSLMIYALAVGELRRACADWCHDVGAELHCVRENEWTHGQRKATRRRALALTEPRYRAVAAQDRGADVADAIELGRWWIAKHANMDDRQ